MPDSPRTPTTLSMRGPAPSPAGADRIPPGSPDEGVPVERYNTLSPIFRTISTRLQERHRIRILDHVKRMLPDGRSLGEGIRFVPSDARRLKSAIVDSGGFHWDDRKVPLYRVAASATVGEGYREYGIPSLHFQVAEGWGNLHLDQYAFVFRLPNGDVFTPDMITHVVDELWWADFVTAVRKKNRFVGTVLGRVHPVLPSSQRGYRPAVGAAVVAKHKVSRDASKTTTVAVEFLQDLKVTPCNPLTCGPKDMASLGERQLLVTVRGTF